MASVGPTSGLPGDSQLGDEGLRARFVSQLKEENFLLYYQPINPALATVPDTAAFREILVRYKDEEKDMLPPGSFLPILEEQGLLPILDRWVVARLLKWGRGLPGGKMPRCSVNLSIDTVRRDKAFDDYVVKMLEKSGVAPSALNFEIMTTDALAYPDAVARLIPPLKSAGVTFALSWFAGEETALELAPRLGVSMIKIDGSLASSIARDPKQKAYLASLVQRCRAAGMRTVCMLVEDAETLAHLRTIRVDYVQGFGIAKPRALESY